MHLVAPDILAAARGLSVPVCAGGLILGLILWLTGGLAHRFWLVLFITVAAGIRGLSLGEAYGVQPLVSGLLLAVAAGALGLSLARLLAFVGGGLAACLAAERLVPLWDEPFVFFFVGGFVGMLFVRLWVMVLSSLAGSLLMAYSGLWLFEALGKLDAAALAGRKPVLLNWACGGIALLGLLLQLVLERRRRRKSGSKIESDGAARGNKDGKEPRQWKLWWWTPPSDGKKDRRAA
jgi:hypothetical protein